MNVNMVVLGGRMTRDADLQFSPDGMAIANIGTGIGLAISQRLALALGGRIDFDSEQHQGSVFTLIVSQ